MKYALISTAPVNVRKFSYSGEKLVEEIVEKPAGTIVNIIEYDGTSTFNPGDNLTLVEVTDDKEIGDYGL